MDQGGYFSDVIGKTDLEESEHELSATSED